MTLTRTIAVLAVLPLLATSAASAQSINVSVSRSILADQPYTLIYPDFMVATGAAGEPVTINHPEAPLQCTSEIVPIEDTGWTAQSALDSLDEDEVIKGWIERFPGFTITNKTVTQFQSGDALLYEGTSTDSPMNMPLTIVHTETVDGPRGYSLDCLYATEYAEQARPIVNFIIANFSTHSDADCCVDMKTEDTATPQ
ncbi:hypothetical protein PSQ90_14420 [Devosia rhodophyticola]|uniref:Uncharacterized protein n=1 Tax=Devosia rhodophyticola TaxID=3026423 RepID=A0ABY7YW47_9HYPH|nr:hypothetical protein [Devosia rhodophyticola]WDR05461.1 hypothetical protein PSQ90_14420 [Devosia rhodophyticola]